MTFRCLLIGQSPFVNSPPPLLVSNLNDRTIPLHSERSNSLETSLKSSKSHFRRLRFDQNNSCLMNGSDSISDPVACRISYTGSNPSARGSAPTRLGSARLIPARLAADEVAGGSTVLTCQLTGRWHGMLTSQLHQVDVIPGMPTVHDDIIIMSCWRHPYPGQSHGSGQLVFGSGHPIRAKKTRATRGGRLCEWPATSSSRGSAWGRFWRSISTRFSPVASSLPPLHSGMVKTQFW
jgi:hypothetical protein